MAELESFATGLEDENVTVGRVGVAVVDRPLQPFDAELTAVDHRVVTGRDAVAVEACRDELVGDHARCGPRVRARFLLVELDAEDVVDVPVREHRGVEPGRRPFAHRFVHARGMEHAAGVDDHEPVGGREHRRVGECLHERDRGQHLGELAGASHRVVLVDRRVAREQPVGQPEQLLGHLCHARQSGSGCLPVK